MLNKPNEHVPDEDVILNRLIRDAIKKSEKQFDRPDSDDIVAYLMGTATNRQKKKVRKALLQSSGFRREILEIAKDMEDLARLELPEKEEVVVPLDLEYVKTHIIKKHSIWTDLKERFRNFWTTLVKLKIPQVYAPAVATIVLLLVVGIHHMGKKQSLVLSQLYLTSKNIEPELLVKVTLKGFELEKGYSKPDSAALASMRSLLDFDWNRHEFLLVQPKRRPKPSFPYRTLLVQMVDFKGKKLRKFLAHIPDTKLGRSEPVIAWVLGLPSRDLYKLEMPSDSLQVEWILERGIKGCITFTYRDESGYSAVPGFTFELK